MLASAIVSGLLLGGIYSLVGAGLNLIFGVIKIINFAQGALLMFGAYLSYWTVTWLGIDPYLTLPIVIVGMGLFGYLVQRALINPVLKHERTSQLLITFGVGLAIQNGALALWGPDIRFVKSFAEYRTLEVLGVRIGISAAIAIVGAGLVIGLFFLFLNKTRVGTAIRAVAQQADSALLSGIDVKRIYAIAFALGSAMVGIAAVLIIPIYDIFPLMGEQFGVIAFIVVVLGGLGNVQGAAIAGLFLGLAQNLFAIYVSNQLSIALLFLIFLVTLLFRPQGLFVRKLRVA